jgi:predicted glycosyltransferase
VRDINIPVVYTGFIAQQADPASSTSLRRELAISCGQKLIVASAGGGRSGYKLLTSVIDACELLRDRLPVRLEVFGGPFMEEEEFEKLSARTSADFRIRRYTKRFLDYLYAADLSVSLAGYNTCMNLLVTRVPALVYPYSRQQEQPLRANRIKNLLPMEILNTADIHPVALSNHIDQILDQPRTSDPLSVDFCGAANAASFLNRWVNESLR